MRSWLIALTWPGLLAAADAATAAAPDEPPVAPATRPAADVRTTMREVWRRNVASPRSAGSSRELAELVEAIMTMDDAARRRPRAKTPATRPAPAAAASQPTAPRAAPTTQVSDSDEGGLTPQTIQRLKELAPMGGPSDTVTMADVLFGSGHLEGAAAFYELALDMLTDKAGKSAAEAGKGNDGDGGDPAWALYQLANSRLPGDPVRARDTYQRLITQFPECPWAYAARAQVRAVTWRLLRKPEQVIKQADPAAE